MRDRQRLFLMVLSTSLAVAISLGVRQLNHATAQHSTQWPAWTLPKS